MQCRQLQGTSFIYLFIGGGLSLVTIFAFFLPVPQGVVSARTSVKQLLLRQLIIVEDVELMSNGCIVCRINQLFLR